MAKRTAGATNFRHRTLAVPWDDLRAYLVALFVYPGLVTMAGLGLAAEMGAAWALVPERGGAASAAAATLRARRPARALPPLAIAAALLAMAAATQLAAPFNPVPPAQRNALLAAVALLGTSWLTWSWGWGRRGTSPEIVLAVQACWLLAMLLPAIAPGNLRPQALGAVVLGPLVPLKIACGVLYVGCLPALLMLLPEAAPQGPPGSVVRGRVPEETGFTIVRALLWVPYCGLFTSLFFPSSDDALGVVRFLLVTAGAAALGIALAANLARRPAGVTRTLYVRLALPLAGFAVLVAMVTSVVVH
jgi:hypothetical protein